MTTTEEIKKTYKDEWVLVEVINVQCIVHDLPEASRIDGLLGLSFLRWFKVCLDFKNGVLEIE